jgi:hypothetical protein
MVSSAASACRDLFGADVGTDIRGPGRGDATDDDAATGAEWVKCGLNMEAFATLGTTSRGSWWGNGVLLLLRLLLAISSIITVDWKICCGQ